MGGLSSYVMRALGQVGTAQTADLLRHHYVHDAEYGRDAVAAVHAIDPRTQRCSDRAIRDTEEATQHRRTGRGHTTS
jgi:hypothetical protein